VNMPWQAFATLAGAGISAGVSAKVASDNRRFQERMTKNRYQYQTADMQAAGLNPMLAYGQQPPASPPGAMAQIPDFGATANAAFMGYAQRKLLKEQEKKEKSATGLNDATKTLRTAEARLRTAEAVKAELVAKGYGVPSTALDWLFKPQNWKAPKLTPAQQQKRRQDAWQYQNQGVPHSGKSGKRQRTHGLDWDRWMEEFRQDRRKQQPDYMEGWDDYTEKMRGRW